MKVLHTSDWHLGQKLIGQSREQEHRMFLDWLLETIESEKPEVLLVSGDIFDVHNPPAFCEELYYGFLAGLLKSPCENIIITGGNHDSASRLEAPSSILKHLNVHIIGNAPQDAKDVLVSLKNAKNKLIATVAAVPFLRERNLGAAQAGETFAQRIERIQTGIRDYYHDAAAALTATQKKLPCLAMGHLFATGASAGEEQNNIYIGNLQNIGADDFPKAFDYIALGHIHRPQVIGKKEHIRYCGSPISLSFSEVKDEKQVLLIEFSGKKVADIHPIKVPVFRKLRRVKGDLAHVQAEIKKYAAEKQTLPTWLELVIDSENRLTALDQQIRTMCDGLSVEVLKWRNLYPGKALSEQVEQINLSELSPTDVFLQKIENHSLDEETKKELEQQFHELFENVKMKVSK